MTPEQAKFTLEKLLIAKQALDEAVEITASSSSVEIACTLGSLRDRLHKIIPRVEQRLVARKLTMRQFARQRYG